MNNKLSWPAEELSKNAVWSWEASDFFSCWSWETSAAASICGIEPRIKCQRLHLILKHIFQDAKMSKKWEKEIRKGSSIRISFYKGTLIKYSLGGRSFLVISKSQLNRFFILDNFPCRLQTCQAHLVTVLCWSSILSFSCHPNCLEIIVEEWIFTPRVIQSDTYHTPLVGLSENVFLSLIWLLTKLKRRWLSLE